ncbi:N-acetylmuramoyl-L-alanine amidase [Flavobacterium rivuli WB 3.3-2 = DSM 21788]|uniref:N-acetylmuramoyl-L-alanine amidase n=1 Tax=Flavobacterium rivuli WB 3.3-2 = DSM 21788 TaxID=1121895 RepID=A0A0A2M780_9FLAO|nr:N-acetylmuramoyl-L-alanine amidase [Flavobacterium rivuli]KGO88512.1 N-acetylmuramoyl-L-alanine amidase [Flavobacterium rivuli WB 3.3-2 = DSM 21788]
MTRLTKKYLFYILILLCTASFGQSKKFKVVLDAGHGGGDEGTAHNSYKEKAIVLSVALKIGKILEDEPGFNVVYTRKTDVFIELRERANIANKADADLFVSIHCNGVNAEQAQGTETFVMGLSRSKINLEVARKENSVITLEKDYKLKYKGFNPDNPDTTIGIALAQEESLNQSIILAGKIRDGFKNDLKKNDRGIKQIPLWVLDATAMPGVLIELGFISNKAEGAYLNSADGQEEMAKSIAKAIISYKKMFDGNASDSEQQAEITEAVKEVTSDKKNEVEPEAEQKDTVAKAGVVFKVQISSSGRDLATKPSNFKGLKNISKLKSGSQIKYFYGETTDYSKTAKLLSEAKSKGFTSAYVVAFRKNKIISIAEALK